MDCVCVERVCVPTGHAHLGVGHLHSDAFLGQGGHGKEFARKARRNEAVVESHLLLSALFVQGGHNGSPFLGDDEIAASGLHFDLAGLNIDATQSLSSKVAWAVAPESRTQEVTCLSTAVRKTKPKKPSTLDDEVV